MARTKAALELGLNVVGWLTRVTRLDAWRERRRGYWEETGKLTAALVGYIRSAAPVSQSLTRRVEALSRESRQELREAAAQSPAPSLDDRRIDHIIERARKKPARQREELLDLADHLVGFEAPRHKVAEAPGWYRDLAHQIEREDELANRRLTWLMTAQALLFAALGVVGGSDELDASLVGPLMAATMLVGVLSAASAIPGLSASLQALDELKTCYLCAPAETRRHLIRPFGSRSLHRRGAGFLGRFPYLFLLAWGVVIIGYLGLKLASAG